MKHDGNDEDVSSGISSEHKWTKNLMITKFPNTISSGKILYRYHFFSYPFLPGHLSLCTDTHFHGCTINKSNDLSVFVSEGGGVGIFFFQSLAISKWTRRGENKP